MPVLDEGLGEFAVCSDSEIECSYPICRFEIVPQSDSAESTSFFLISDDGKVLVAFLQKAWSRRAQSRLLPPSAISKALCFEGGASEPESRKELVLGVACIGPQSIGYS